VLRENIRKSRAQLGEARERLRALRGVDTDRLEHRSGEGPRLDQVVRAAGERRRLDGDADALGELGVVEAREHVDRQRPDAVEVEMHVVARQVELLEIGAHGLAGKAALAKRRDRRAALALRELLPVRADDQAVMDDVRRLRAECAVEVCVQLFVHRAVIGATDHVRDLEVDVVDDAREMERRRAVVAPQHHALEALRQAGDARSLEVPRRSLALANGTLVPLEPEPLQVLDDALDAARDVARRVRVVDAEQQPVAEAPVRDRAERASDVQRSGRARREADADHQSAAAASSKSATYAAERLPGTSSAATVHTARKHVESTKPSVKPVTVGLPLLTWSARNVATSWPPSAPPTVRMTVFMPLATPVSWSDTAWMTMFPSAANARPIPMPRSAALISMSYGWPCATASQPNATPVTADPATSAAFDPKRAAMRPAKKPTTNMPTVDGRRYSAETTIDAPKPKPVLFGSCANCGKTMKDEYIPAPSRKAVTFAVQTARTRISLMSMSGSLLRTSTRTHATQKRTPAASITIVFVPPQPHTVVSLTATRTRVMPALISAAASQLMRPGTRTGDSGTNRHVQTVATTSTASGSQKSQCQLRCSTIKPPSTIPTPPPTPSSADISPMLPATFSRGNSSRMIPNASGKTPPPAPWMTRATISSATELETPASSVPPLSTISVHTSRRSLPYMSPSRPRIAVPTDAESR